MVSHRPRERKCIYCDAKADSLEHVIPHWIPEHFGLSGEVMTHNQAVGITRVGGVRFGDFAARIYCGTHHEHINRTIENNPTRELIKRLFRGTAGTLDRNDQTLLAAWAAKTCYAQWGMVRRRRGIPIAHRRYLMENGKPHPSVFVSVSHCTGERIRVIYATSVRAAARSLPEAPSGGRWQGSAASRSRTSGRHQRSRSLKAGPSAATRTPALFSRSPSPTVGRA